MPWVVSCVAAGIRCWSLPRLEPWKQVCVLSCYPAGSGEQMATHPSSFTALPGKAVGFVLSSLMIGSTCLVFATVPPNEEEHGRRTLL